MVVQEKKVLGEENESDESRSWLCLGSNIFLLSYIKYGQQFSSSPGVREPLQVLAGAGSWQRRDLYNCFGAHIGAGGDYCWLPKGLWGLGYAADPSAGHPVHQKCKLKWSQPTSWLRSLNWKRVSIVFVCISNAQGALQGGLCRALQRFQALGQPVGSPPRPIICPKSSVIVVIALLPFPCP